MAVEIKELIIRAVVDYQQEKLDPGAPGASPGAVPEDREALIQACVRQVLKIINRSNKR